MSFLHSKEVFHRDLKSANVLIFVNRRLKLCDFGLSKIKTDLSSIATSGAVGTTQWMSPELMNELSQADELTDVNRWGMWPSRSMVVVVGKGRLARRNVFLRPSRFSTY